MSFDELLPLRSTFGLILNTLGAPAAAAESTFDYTIFTELQSAIAATLAIGEVKAHKDLNLAARQLAASHPPRSWRPCTRRNTTRCS